MLILSLTLLTLGCTESNIVSPPFTKNSFYSKVTDLNVLKVNVGDYNNFLAGWNANGDLTAFDVNDLNIALPDLSNYYTKVDSNNLFAMKTDVNSWGDARYLNYCSDTNRDLNNSFPQFDSNFKCYRNVTLSDLNIGSEFVPLISDVNSDYGFTYCADGNIVVGYLKGFSC